MPRKKSKQSASGDFDSAFDDDLDDIQTPVDSLGEDFIEPIEPSINIPAEKPLNISTKNDISNKFGLKKSYSKCPIMGQGVLPGTVYICSKGNTLIKNPLHKLCIALSND